MFSNGIKPIHFGTVICPGFQRVPVGEKKVAPRITPPMRKRRVTSGRQMDIREASR